MCSAHVGRGAAQPIHQYGRRSLRRRRAPLSHNQLPPTAKSPDSPSVTQFPRGLPPQNRAFSVVLLQFRDTVSFQSLSLFRISAESIELTILRIPEHTLSPIPVMSVQSVGGIQYRRQISRFYSSYKSSSCISA